ncbi:MAG: DUF1831 domain-containing protein [Streptococcaceae bacterium]|nr:DUF1831 domain-containing protein [Streptococcaceae bacterium]
MGYETKIKLPGSNYTYNLHENVKRFSLRDNGFIETKQGNFQLVRPLDATPQSREGFKLKITVNKEINGFKMSITTANGLRSVDIFKDEKYKMNQDKFYFLMDGMIERNVFDKE